MIWIKLAWRNIFRNKRRTYIAGIAIGMGLASLIFVDALVIGMEKNMIHSATASYLGEGQIHRQNFRQTQDADLTINDLSQVIDSLKQEKTVRAYSIRAMSMGMITSPADVQAINFVGVDPTLEKNVSQLDEAITEGSFFGDDNPRDVLIGSKLAEILEVGLGDRVVITVSQVESGDLAQEMFRISGIYHFNMAEMDQGMAFVRLKKAQEMLGLNSRAHEIAIQFTDTRYGMDKKSPFWNRYSKNGNIAEGWIIILPQMEAVFELSQFSTLLTGLILFGVVALGIINTLFMSIHERMFEFGVLRAVGTRPWSVARLLLLEAAALAVISIIMGNILGFISTYIVSQIGIDYTGIEFSGVTFRELLYPEMNLGQFIKYPIWVFIFTVITGIYPAIHAARMSPANSLRKSM
jgi:ABC-type lipoprotein release transport system permease subunit